MLNDNWKENIDLKLLNVKVEANGSWGRNINYKLFSYFAI